MIETRPTLAQGSRWRQATADTLHRRLSDQAHSAVTHYAAVAAIEPYGKGGKYQLIFSGASVEITPIPFADAPAGLIKGPRYCTLGKLLKAKTLSDLF